jgi:hypothetical protein
MFQKKQPAKKFAFSLGPKKQQNQSTEESSATEKQPPTDSDNGKRDLEESNSQPVIKRPKLNLGDEEELLESAGIKVNKGIKCYSIQLSWIIKLITIICQ